MGTDKLWLFCKLLLEVIVTETKVGLENENPGVDVWVLS